MSLAMRLRILLLITLLFVSFKSYATTIYQGFDEPFSKIEQKLHRLKELGYTYIQISPPQKSLPQAEWWARYQPIDHSVIEGFLGNESELKQLIEATHKHGMKLLVDTILNHMADSNFNSGHLTYPEFTKDDFHFPDARPCIKNYSDRYQVTHHWLCSDSGDHQLPDLDTGSPKVRAILLKYLEKLISLGVDGFRFDAMKHIEPEFWGYLISHLKDRGLYYYGEVIGQTLEESSHYTPFSDITDFHLLGLMIQTFSLGGDLRNLHDPIHHGRALSTPSVLFARNHDTVMHDNFFKFGDYTDAMLANAYILGRGLGTISIYRDDFEHPLVTAGIKFRHQTSGLPTRVIPVHEICKSHNHCDARTLMFMSRGNSHLMILNTAAHPVDLSDLDLKFLQKGCYESLDSKNRFYNDHSQHLFFEQADGTQNVEKSPLSKIKLHARSATFIVPTTRENCH
jgi:alpha-amylase